MNRHNLYILTSIIIGLLIMAVLGWALYVNHKQTKLTKKVPSVESFSDSFGDLGVPQGYNNTMFGKAITADQVHFSDDEQALLQMKG